MDSFGILSRRNPSASSIAKQTPLTDDPRRVIVGIGGVLAVAPGKSYDMESGGPFHSMIWDRPVEHSIRANCLDGFLLPYHDAITFASKHPGYDVSKVNKGLPCGQCGLPTESTLSYLYECKKCSYSSIKRYPNAIEAEDPRYCNLCNP